MNEEENSEMIDCQDERQLNNEDNGEKVQNITYDQKEIETIPIDLL